MPARFPSLAALIAALVLAAPAGAADVLVRAVVAHGDLSTQFPAGPIDLPTVNLDNGGDQTVDVQLPFVVTDMRGTGAGWSLTVESNGFTQNGGPMPGTSAAVVGASAQCVAGEQCTLPQGNLAYPVGVPVGATPARFFSAAAGTGMGTTDLHAHMTVTVPGNAYAGSFSTTLTLSQSAGP